MRRVLSTLVTLALVLATVTAHADIFRWDNGQLIPGTEGIASGPGLQLSAWNSEARNLRYADFSGGLDLRLSNFQQSWLDHARFTRANLERANLMNADLGQANLTGASLWYATLANADLSDAVVEEADFRGTTAFGFTKEQLYSTASYKAQDLKAIRFGSNDLSSWSFAGQNLAGAEFFDATLSNADFSDAVVTGASFSLTTTRGFAKEQLYTTASYKAFELRAINWLGNDLSNWNFAGQNLAGGTFDYATLAVR